MVKLERILCLLIFILLLNNIAQAQVNMLVSFTEFEAIVKSLKVTGFSSVSEITEEQGEYAEYQAYFISGNEMFSVKLEPRKGGPTWSSQPYLLDGKKAEFAVTGNLSMLFVDLPAIESVLTLISNKIKDKQQLEQIARKTGLLEKTPKAVAWPSEIPVAYRPDCTIVSSKKYESDVDGYTTDFVITVVMDDKLKASIRRLRSAYEDNGHYIAFPDATLLTTRFGELDDLNSCCENGEKIELTFNLP